MSYTVVAVVLLPRHGGAIRCNAITKEDKLTFAGKEKKFGSRYTGVS